VTYCVLLATGPFQTLAPFAAGVGAAGLAFLPWNMWNARAFLGDSGSYFIGGAVGMLSLATIASGNLVAGLLPLATYAADTGTVVLRHLAKAQPVILAHHDHTYQQMLVQGWPHPRTAFVTALFSTACCVLALLAQGQGMPGQTLATAATVLVCFLYLSLPRWSRRRQMRSGQGRTQ
jgi:UDP-N-acetylmuramyl pentapeptide phosphotransferase/UDP-N-acetylglucosamine-1-phosphate transferase